MRRFFEQPVRWVASWLFWSFGFFGCVALIDLIWPASSCQVGRRDAMRRDIFAKVSVVVADLAAISFICCFATCFFFFLYLSDRNDCADYVTQSIDLCAKATCAQRLPSGADQFSMLLLALTHFCWPYEWNGGPKAATTTTAAQFLCKFVCCAAA